MPNEFSGIFNDEFKNAYNNAIDSVLEGFSVPCELYFPSTTFQDCLACKNTPIGLRGPNPHLPGNNGTHTGNCPTCSGTKKIKIQQKEIIDLVVIWDYNYFKDIASLTKSPEGRAQTVCNISLIDKIKRAEYIILNKDIALSSDHRFYRDGEPTPAGMGAARYIITNWAKNTA